MLNTEIKLQTTNLTNDYLRRLTGIQSSTLHTEFTQWLALYSDGFKSVGDALKLFVAEYDQTLLAA